MKNVNNMKKLKEFAFGITEPIEVTYPQFGKTDVIEPVNDRKLDGKYYVNNGIMSFVSEGVMYVVPYTEKALQILLKQGFICDGVKVPFSNWEYPTHQNERWESIKAKAYMQRCLETQ